ncbi:MAG: alpha/beta fold hydrolase, partial [Proteobacteria bacterium]|nr:alpha/beta fold hydrolase [Pseudomonadota bacterium]
IALDSRGQGRSTRGGAPMTYARMADDALALLDHLKVAQASIVGWSDGGITGLELARRHPERVRRLFAFGANADPSGGTDPGAADPVVAAYHERARAEYRALSPAPGEWPALEVAMAKMWETEPNLSAAQLAAIRVPVTVADGEHEEFVRPEHTRYLARTIPGARLVILPATSHFALLQDPAAFAAAVLEFLGR